MKKYRPLHTEYKVIARTIQGDHHMKMSEDQFVENVKRFAYDELSEKRIRQIYRSLAREF
jgi:hypothetical protein